ncbi:MAG: U32 family peptidase [Candidatus Micrarchaeota archaeon]|nr:U32 family peptidase [Candidatus Micrarchaeota archaeon]
MPIELLAPAGSPSSLKAAIDAGADSVYFGSVWNARMRARNFTKEEIPKAIKYCHDNSAKAYITLNTLIFQHELDPVSEYISFLYEYGADAIIIQDLGAMEIARQVAPDLEVHASTQISTHNSKTASMLKKMGFSRAILARELSIGQAENIGKASGIETEVFCHGSLCYSYSGKCNLSFFQSGRSGNRGACAQLCRLPWKLSYNGKIIKKGYLTGTKDLNTIDEIEKIKKSSIRCIKIEGRQKGPTYISRIVGAYRKAIDTGESSDLSFLTQRGYTKGYLFGNARKEKLTNPNESSFSGTLVGKVERIASHGATIRLCGTLREGDSIRASSSNKVIEIYRMYRNRQQVTSSSDFCNLMIKTLKPGDQIFRVERERIDEDYINQVFAKRERKARSRKLEIRIPEFEKMPDLFYAYNERDLLEDNESKAVVVPLDIATRENVKSLKNAIIRTPRVVFDEEMEDVEKKIKEMKEENPFAIMAAELSMVSDYRTIIDGYANISNSLAASEWKGAGNVISAVASPEIGEDAANKIGLIPFMEKKVELLISENDLAKELDLEDLEGLELIDPRGNRLKLKRRDGRTIILK